MSGDRYKDESPRLRAMEPLDPDGSGDTVIDEEPPEELLRLVQEALENAPPDPELFHVPGDSLPPDSRHLPGDSLPPIPDADDIGFSDEMTVGRAEQTKKDHPVFDDEPDYRPIKDLRAGAKFGGSPAHVSFDSPTEGEISSFDAYEEATESALDDWGESIDLTDFDQQGTESEDNEKQSTLDLVVMSDMNEEPETDRSRLIDSPPFEGTEIGPLGPVELTASQFLLVNSPVHGAPREVTEPSGSVNIIEEAPDPESQHGGEPETEEEPVPSLARKVDIDTAIPAGWPFDDIALAETRTQAVLSEELPEPPRKKKDPFRLSSIRAAPQRRSFFSGRTGIALLCGIAVLIAAGLFVLFDQVRGVPEELDATAVIAKKEPDPTEVPDPTNAEPAPTSDEKSPAKTEAKSVETPKKEIAKAPPPAEKPPQPHPAPKPSKVNIKFDVAPKRATVKVDGKVQKGPLVVPQSDKRYDVEVSAPGYLTMKHTFTAEASRLVELKLEKAPVEIKPVKKKRVRRKRVRKAHRRVAKKQPKKKSSEVLVRGDDL